MIKEPRFKLKAQFESNFFNVDYYKLDIADLNEEICFNDSASSVFELVATEEEYYKYHSLVNEKKFYYSSSTVRLSKDIKNKIKPNVNYSLATPDDLLELQLIAENAYLSSRFSYVFDINQVNSFYFKWIENAISSKFDDACIIIRDGDKIIGFITYRIVSGEVILGLMGVSAKHRGLGVGASLLNIIDYISHVSGEAKKIKVATQATNIAALNLYQKNGFKITEIKHWFYKRNV